MTNPEPLEVAAERLASTVTALRETIQEANNVKAELGDLAKRGRRNRVLITLVGIGFFVHAGLIAAMIAFGIQLNEVVQTQRDSALCPLYDLILQSDTKANEDRAKAAGLDIKERRRAYDIIQGSYAALECDN